MLLGSWPLGRLRLEYHPLYYLCRLERRQLMLRSNLPAGRNRDLGLSRLLLGSGTCRSLGCLGLKCQILKRARCFLRRMLFLRPRPSSSKAVDCNRRRSHKKACLCTKHWISQQYLWWIDLGLALALSKYCIKDENRTDHEYLSLDQSFDIAFLDLRPNCCWGQVIWHLPVVPQGMRGWIVGSTKKYYQQRKLLTPHSWQWFKYSDYYSETLLKTGSGWFSAVQFEPQLTPITSWPSECEQL